MLALSIQQPWAWLIVNGHKDVENRTWECHRRGRTLIHAGKKPYVTGDEYVDLADELLDEFGIRIPAEVELQLGGIVGVARLVDCFTEVGMNARGLNSKWFSGPYGFLFQEQRPLPFVPFRGQLGFFDVPATLVEPAGYAVAR